MTRMADERRSDPKRVSETAVALLRIDHGDGTHGGALDADCPVCRNGPPLSEDDKDRA